jgi:hypothetical protein
MCRPLILFCILSCASLCVRSWLGNVPSSGSSFLLHVAAPQTLSGECATDPTSFDGARDTCKSDVSTLRAPVDHVFVMNSAMSRRTSAAGESPECHLEWAEHIEIIPGTGITQPQAVAVWATARSPAGPGQVKRGWSRCEYTIQLTKWR